MQKSSDKSSLESHTFTGNGEGKLCDCSSYFLTALFLQKKMNIKQFILFAYLFVSMPLLTESGIVAYGICQTGCNTVAVACYAAAGFTFGVSTFGAGIPAAIVGCNTALGFCMATCAALLLTPTP